jgi:short-subunit dehydrogenase
VYFILKIKNMNVVITGATKGIGLATAETFARAGHNIITCARHKDDLQELQRNFQTLFPGITVKVKVADLANEEEVKGFAKWIDDENLPSHVLVNNAGYFVPGSIYNEEAGTLQKMMQVNVYSAYQLIRLLLPGMIERKRGHIFNICSIASLTGMPNVGAYGISKYALLGLTKHLREEMKPFGIKVTAISPGATFTASWEGTDIKRERFIEANDVAKMIVAATQLSAAGIVEDIILQPQ